MKLTISKSKNAESLYICHSFVNNDGKSTSKTHKRLGNMAELSSSLGLDRDGVITWAKEQVRIATLEYKKECENVSISLSPTQLIKIDDQRSFNCGYLFLQSLLTKLHFDNICRNMI